MEPLAIEPVDQSFVVAARDQYERSVIRLQKRLNGRGSNSVRRAIVDKTFPGDALNFGIGNKNTSAQPYDPDALRVCKPAQMPA